MPKAKQTIENTNKVGPFDYDSLMILQNGEGIEPSLFERRLKIVITKPTGEPRAVLDLDTPYVSLWARMREHERAVRAYVLVPVTIKRED